MDNIVADVLIVGSGLGATAAAKRLAEAGQSVVLVPGIGRTRSPHIDGGVVDPALVEAAFGPGEPLGETVERLQLLSPVQDRRFGVDPGFLPAPRRMYHRGTLESWAMDRAMAAGAVFLNDFIERKALPNPDGSMRLTSERDERVILAGRIVLCEGADPRIPLRVKLRPDYRPDDQIHFARTTFEGAIEPAYRLDLWRTSWGMPVGVQIVPQMDGVILSVSARIENVMRGSRSAKDALEDFLRSPVLASLGFDGQRGDTGVELVAIRPHRRDIPFAHDRMLMGVDASGVIDARRIDRADLTLQSGLLLADVLVEDPAGWDDRARRFVDDLVPAGTACHHSRQTGFLEETIPGPTNTIAGRLVRRARRGRR